MDDPEKIVEQEAPASCLDDVLKEAKGAVTDRHGWITQQREWYTIRYGMRAKKKFPWPGASNLHIPLTDKVIRRLKPIFISAVFGVDPICTFEPLGATSIDSARTFEVGYDWLVRYRMKNAQEQAGFWTDFMLGGGFGLAKCVWEYEARKVTRRLKVDWVPQDVDRKEFLSPTELEIDIARRSGIDKSEKDFTAIGRSLVRQFLAGDEELVWERETVFYNAPKWYAVDPQDFIAPWDATTDIDAMPWCAHRMFLHPHEMRERMESGRYKRAETQRALEAGPSGGDAADPAGELEQRKQMREGVDGKGVRSETKHELWELYYREKDGCKRVATVHMVSGEVLRDMEYQYEHDEWPFTRFSFEMNEDRWYSSRGVPSMLYDLQKELNAQHNSKIDNMSISTSKSFIYRHGSIRNPEKWKFRPGVMFPVMRMTDIQPIQHMQTDWVHEREEMNLRQNAEEYVGTPDFGISNINQRVERRTATEIEQIQNSSGAVAEETLRRYQRQMRRLHRQTLLLWQQYGDDQVEVRVTGTDKSLVFVRFDLQKEYDLVPSGRIDNLNSQQRAQQALTVLQLAESPLASKYVNHFEVVRDILENLNYRNSKRYLQAPGVWEQDALLQQVHEVSMAETIGEVPPVDQSDPHELHVSVLQQIMANKQDDQELMILLAGHLALHAYFLGERGVLQQYLQQTGGQVQEAGSRLLIVLPKREGGEDGGQGGSGDAGAAGAGPPAA